MKKDTIEVKAGNIYIGAGHPVVVQSMTNTDTLNTAATISQIKRLVAQGCQMVRLTAADIPQAENIYNIKNGLISQNIDVPIVADIHFSPKAAEIAASVADKIRINPGNYTDRKWNPLFTEQDYRDMLKKTQDNLTPLIDICKKHSTAVRIGVNHGSLSERILFKYGNTPLAMAESAAEFLRIFAQEGFDQIVVSMKASDASVMYAANKILVQKTSSYGKNYPLHLGVTEAGNGQDGRIKSICGIAPLLLQGIGDTIRVSLTEKPENEIPVALKLARLRDDFGGILFDDAEKYYSCGEVSSDDVQTYALIGRISYDLLEKKLTSEEFKRTAFSKSNPQLAKDILQALGIERYKAEFVACPSCGRTKYDIESAFEAVKKACSHLKGLKIAVMGCIVNGPGEMADADYGYIGAGNGKVNLYKGGELVKYAVEEKDALSVLKEIIKQDGKWTDAE